VVPIVLLAIALAVSVLMNLGMGVSRLAHSAGGIKKHTLKHGGEDEFPKLSEKWSYGSGDTKVARIALAGVISRASEGSLFGATEDLVSRVSAQIRQARNDEEIKAIILEVDSPGGGVTPSDELWNELKEFRASAEDRKVIVFMRDLCASGGYYVSAAGDWLIAEPTTIVGSIGVIMSTLNMKGLSEKIGIKDVTIKSGANKDLLNPFSEVNPEQLALLQQMIDASYARFFNIVKESRNFDEAKLKALADGRIFDAGEALKEGFIDQIGYWDDAIAKTAELLGVDAVKVIRYESEPSLFQLLTSAKNPLRLPESHGPRLQYLWSP
jgi:protease-4